MVYLFIFCVLFIVYQKRHIIVDIIDYYANPAPLKEDLYDYELKLFMDMKYKYLKSYIWKDKIHQVKVRDNWSCVLCNSSKELVVHHLKDYDRIPNEPISSLVLLCRTCHQIQHDYYGYPTTLEEYKNWNVKVV